MDKKVGRNDPCPCCSGKKYKKCCEAKHKHKKFEAKILSSSTMPSHFFDQAQDVSGFFQRKFQALTPTESVEGKKSEEKEELPKDPTVGHEEERVTDL